MTTDRILTKPELDAALDALCALDPRMAALRREAAEPPLRTLTADLAGLVWIVNSQLISVAAARAIHGRLQAALGVIDHASLSAAPDETFRAAGLSRVKLRTVRALCAAVDAGLDIAALSRLDEDEARARLVAISGVGPWTADVFLLFAHGRADAFPGGDVAVQAAMKEAFALEARPDRAQAERIAERWRPLRGVAAQLLWAYYLRKRGGRDAAPAPNRPESAEETT
ncbi:DNA-3-methyladenine glycosylase family protein [Chenggangzhangella methanolivorans]|uniref:DNA-3-methyladenine glycosylase II n=1 Tax=Chenggangzhangella methanolivorans TaxID=1437009 RepID=A0A9E6UNG0_9HYPH|nr:DNA-3-methyladenine glycosylase 2 family protein [Chenggangzhangella methanolivorans]QZN98489.1 DNA-3-methyladenine glycosylase 2 family protein [Chenggangzhangella methanolivorans]